MSVTLVVGGQWGDEGKGKVVDLLSAEADWVIRAQGGSNAGHTVVNPQGTFKLHLIPAGVFYPGVRCLLGTGMVIDPEVLLEEMAHLEQRGFPLEGRLFLSSRAHLVLPYHRLLDGVQEDLRGEGAIGTTRRGIGPAYADKAARTGVRMGDLLDEATLLRRLTQALQEKKALLEGRPEGQALSLHQLYLRATEWGHRLAEYIVEPWPLLRSALREGHRILVEGAQGALLDVDYGTYPYVTSSATLPPGLCQGAGLPINAVTRILGVFKAYTTRVGGGPFPTEMPPELAERVRRQGAEFGTTTGRPRRCGWFDLAAARYVVELAGITEVALTKLDVLDGLPELQVCVGYRLHERSLSHVPGRIRELEEVVPEYETLPGWSGPTQGVSRWKDLPPQARAYVEFLEEGLGVPIRWVSTGPQREATIYR